MKIYFKWWKESTLINLNKIDRCSDPLDRPELSVKTGFMCVTIGTDSKDLIKTEEWKTSLCCCVNHSFCAGQPCLLLQKWKPNVSVEGCEFKSYNCQTAIVEPLSNTFNSSLLQGWNGWPFALFPASFWAIILKMQELALGSHPKCINNIRLPLC